jgi:phosphopentomutase
VCGPKVRQGVNLGVRETFSDIAATVSDYFGLKFPTGTSFLTEIKQ